MHHRRATYQTIARAQFEEDQAAPFPYRSSKTQRCHQSLYKKVLPLVASNTQLPIRLLLRVGRSRMTERSLKLACLSSTLFLENMESTAAQWFGCITRIVSRPVAIIHLQQVSRAVLHLDPQRAHHLLNPQQPEKELQQTATDGQWQ